MYLCSVWKPKLDNTWTLHRREFSPQSLFFSSSLNLDVLKQKQNSFQTPVTTLNNKEILLNLYHMVFLIWIFYVIDPFLLSLVWLMKFAWKIFMKMRLKWFWHEKNFKKRDDERFHFNELKMVLKSFIVKWIKRGY